MRKFTHSIWVIVIGISAAGLWCLQLAGSRAQPPGAARSAARSTAAPNSAFDPAAAPGPGSGGMAAGAAGPSNAAAHAFALMKSDGSVENHKATRLYVYQLSPGAAKPKRTDLSSAPSLAGGYGGGLNMGSGYGGGYGGEMMSGGTGMSGMGGTMGPGMMSSSMSGMSDGMMGGAASGVTAGNGGGESGPTWLWAYVFDEPVDPNAQQKFKPVRAEVKIVIPAASVIDAAAGSMSGYGGEMGMSGVTVATMQLLEDPAQPTASSPGSASAVAVPRGSTAELKNIAQLVRLDIWIRDAHTQLKAKRSQANDFAALEKHLKALLDEDYEAQLAKQRNDVAKLREKLDGLQADLERRAQARDRVVNVQLGQLVLDAQGLLNQ